MSEWQEHIFIRNEQERDYRRVEEITRAAFSYPERIERGGIGCPYEHWMVHGLRKRDGILELSLAAEMDHISMPLGYRNNETGPIPSSGVQVSINIIYYLNCCYCSHLRCSQ